MTGCEFVEDDVAELGSSWCGPRPLGCGIELRHVDPDPDPYDLILEALDA